MNLPSYPNMKDSGIEWIGEIPAHWDVVRADAVLESGRTTVTPDFFAGHEVFHYSIPSIQTIGDGACEDGDSLDSSKTLLQGGELLVSKLNPRKGCVLISEKHQVPTVCSTEFVVLKQKNCHLRYAYYFYLSPLVRDCISSYAQSATRSHQRANPDDIRKIEIVLPTLPEQQAIATFLDRKTQAIDAVIQQKERLIELLQEKRQALISHAVTKGLDPTVQMKDSGIEWLGEIPAHWKVKSLGSVTTDINDINHEMPTAVVVGVPFLSAKDLLNDGTLNFTNDVKMISEEDYERLSKKIAPRRNDIIYSRIGACLGKARIVETDIRFLISYSCCVIRLSQHYAAPAFFRYILDSEMVLTEARLRTQGIGVPDLGLKEIARFPIPLPPLEEQRIIAGYLRSHITAIDSLIARTQASINSIREYRQTLISSAVTGKIDLREEV